MLKRMNDERGMAMVVAVMVTFVVLLLSVVVVNLAIHNSNQSGYDRRRIQSATAAEAGIDYYYNYLQLTPLATMNGNCSAATSATQTINSAPQAASFTATATFYDANQAVVTCPFSQTSPPVEAMIRSVGSVGNQVPLAFQTDMKLTPNYGGFSAAIISQGALTLGNNLTINGNTSNDADIYVYNGDFTGSNTPVIYGNVYVRAGNASLSNSTNVRGNLWANGSVSMANNSSVNGNVISSTSSISVLNSAHVFGNATAGTTITGTANIDGTKSPNTTSPTPPSQPFPQIPWVPTDWTNAGYTIQSFSDCTSAMTYILTNPSGNNVVRISAVCPLSFSNNTSISFNGNLAIFTDGSISMANSVSWTGIGGQRKLFFIDAYRTGLNCTGGAYDVSDSNNVSYLSTDVSFYSPCTVNINNLSSMTGQVIGGTVNINNQFTMNFKPVLVPGVGSIVGFNQDIVYLRQVP